MHMQKLFVWYYVFTPQYTVCAYFLCNTHRAVFCHGKSIDQLCILLYGRNSVFRALCNTMSKVRKCTEKILCCNMSPRLRIPCRSSDVLVRPSSLQVHFLFWYLLELFSFFLLFFSCSCRQLQLVYSYPLTATFLCINVQVSIGFIPVFTETSLQPSSIANAGTGITDHTNHFHCRQARLLSS